MLILLLTMWIIMFPSSALCNFYFMSDTGFQLTALNGTIYRNETSSNILTDMCVDSKGDVYFTSPFEISKLFKTGIGKCIETDQELISCTFDHNNTLFALSKNGSNAVLMYNNEQWTTIITSDKISTFSQRRTIRYHNNQLFIIGDNPLILKFSLSGNFIEAINTSMEIVYDMDFDKDGARFISGGETIKKINPDLTEQILISPLRIYRGISVTDTGRVLVADRFSNNSILYGGISGGSVSIIDMFEFPGVDRVFFRVDTQVIPSTTSHSGFYRSSSETSNLLLFILPAFVFIILAVPLVIIIFILKKKRKIFYKRAKKQRERQRRNARAREVTDIQILEMVGQGQFSEVYRGIWQTTTDVAVKKLHAEHKDRFNAEARILQSLRHPNIVQFFGIYVQGTDKYLVTEYLSLGNLQTFLQVAGSKLDIVNLISMAKDSAAGLKYLSQQNVVHRDLTCRNLLVSIDSSASKYTIKVADFGMSKVLKDKFIQSENKMFVPVKWSSIEVLQQGLFSSKSDVWSFGVCMWEIFSYGEVPYPGMSNEDTIKKVCEGYRMDPPPRCPVEIYQLMRETWNSDSEKRPNFSDIFRILDVLWLDYKKLRQDDEQDSMSLFKTHEDYVVEMSTLKNYGFTDNNENNNNNNNDSDFV